MGVSANVLGSCVLTTTPVAFGNYDPKDLAPVNATGTVTVQCSAGTVVTSLTADGGVYGGNLSAFFSTVPKSTSGTTLTRAMSNGVGYIAYDLFTETDYATIWNVSNAFLVGTTLATDAPVTISIFGQIPADESTHVKSGNVITAGAYSDTVRVTATW
jgi:spore coat protein U-like protein